MRDITELDQLANEVRVCVGKSDNYADTARSKIAEVSPALEAGEFGNWNTQHWLIIKARIDVSVVQLYLPRPGEIAAAAVMANPHKSDRAIAKDIGVHHTTVGAARKTTGEYSPVESRVGLDGKKRRTPAQRAPSVAPRSDPVEPNLEGIDWYLVAAEAFQKLDKSERIRFRDWMLGYMGQ